MRSRRGTGRGESGRGGAAAGVPLRPPGARSAPASASVGTGGVGGRGRPTRGAGSARGAPPGAPRLIPASVPEGSCGGPTPPRPCRWRGGRRVPAARAGKLPGRKRSRPPVTARGGRLGGGAAARLSGPRCHLPPSPAGRRGRRSARGDPDGPGAASAWRGGAARVPVPSRPRPSAGRRPRAASGTALRRSARREAAAHPVRASTGR